MAGILLVVLSNAAAAAALAVIVTLIGLRLKRPALLHALWVVVLLRLFAPPLLGFGVLPAVPAAVASDFSGSPVAVEAIERTPVSHSAPWMNLDNLAIAGWLAGSLLVAWVAGRRTLGLICMLRAARPAGRGLTEAVAAVGRHMGCTWLPEVVVVDEAVPPMVWGGFGTATLILPSDLAEQLSHDQLRTLLAHELAHLKRGDHRVRWLELAALLLFWWNPVTWWACRRLRAAEEQCCDAMVARSLPDSVRDYVDGLVATVRYLSTTRAHRFVAASGITNTTEMERRITMLMLRPNTASVPVLVKIALATVAVAVLAFTPLLTARAADGGHEGVGGWQQFTGEPITLNLKDADIRDVLATFATLVQKDILIEPGVQATVSVDVVDTPWDEVLYTILEDHGLQAVEEGDRFIVRKITSPHLPVPPYEVIEDRDGEEVFTFVKHGEISEPRRISCPQPSYPEEARAAGVTGIVVLETIIDATGHVRSIEVARGESHGLTDAAVEAVRGWIFEPAMLDGEPVAVRYVLAVRFALDDKKID